MPLYYPIHLLVYLSSSHVVFYYTGPQSCIFFLPTFTSLKKGPWLVRWRHKLLSKESMFFSVIKLLLVMTSGAQTYYSPQLPLVYTESSELSQAPCISRKGIMVTRDRQHFVYGLYCQIGCSIEAARICFCMSCKSDR